MKKYEDQIVQTNHIYTYIPLVVTFLCSIGQEFYLYIDLVNTFYFEYEVQGPKKSELKVLV